MFTFIAVSFSLLVVFLSGWTITTYFVKEDSQQVIKKELKNLYNISKMFFISIKNLIEILVRNSLSSYSSERSTTETTTTGSRESEEHSLSLFKPVKEVESSSSLNFQLKEDKDIELSSFSPKVIEEEEEEEEKVA
tara:strand:+ start:177 stop:584 length:408 start_codon:yes stop_codon:yes gene_type:complete